MWAGLILSALLLSDELAGQPAAGTDRIVTRYGQRIDGSILAYQPNDSLTLRHTNGTIERFADIDLARIDYAPQRAARPAEQTLTLPTAFRERGWQWGAGMAFLLGKETNFTQVVNCNFRNCTTVEQQNRRHIQGYSLQLSGRYQFSRWLGLGAGLSWDRYYPERYENLLTPELSYRGYLLPGRLSPYISLRGGYGFALKATGAGIAAARGAIMWHPAVGLRLGGYGAGSLSLDVGYRFQSATYYGFADDPNFRQRDVDYRRVVIRLGLDL